jgi:OmpA-OmpF porin, OOP family
MKQVFTIFCLILCLSMIAQDVYAQQPNHKFSFRQNWYNYLTPLRSDATDWKDIFEDSGSRGLEFAYGRRLAGNTWLEVPLKVGLIPFINANKTLGAGRLSANVDALLQHEFFKYTRLLRPTVHLGIGSTLGSRKSDLDFNIPAGVGLNLRIWENFALNARSQYRFSLEDRSGWHHGIGAVIGFGGSDPEPPKPADRDNDGIPDVADKCPDVAGVASAMGCPDRDGDSVADSEDKCPDVAGAAALMGCPDRDADGIADSNDKCPDAAGSAALMGCPDRDGDGIADGDDTCPDAKGTAAMRGCPDTDGDGLADNVDNCPREAGTAANKGCPVADRDGDGIADSADACPDTKGTAAGRGCPDADGDGIYDNEDRCPDKAGTAANKGCPEIKAEDKAKLERAIKLVQFESGKAILLQKSNAVLDEVVSVMKQYPEYSLNIEGHTDNQGDDKMNQQLSERRAKACLDYLVTKGVAASRMASAGYGETRPVANNATAAGREQNRRVQFELYVK